MNFYQLFYKSLYNLRVIAYIRFQQVTKSLLHVTVFTLLACLPFLIMMSFSLSAHLNQLKTIVDQDLPTFTIEQNQLINHEDEPFIQFSNAAGYVIIDPTNQLTEQDILQHNVGIALRKDEMISFENGQSQAFSYALLGIEQMSNEQISERISSLVDFLPILLPLIAFLIYAGLLGVTFLGITCLAVIGLLLKGKRTQLLYRHLWVMSAYAITLPVILYGWLDSFISISPLYLIAFCVSILYAVILKVPLPKKKEKKE